MDDHFEFAVGGLLHLFGKVGETHAVKILGRPNGVGIPVCLGQDGRNGHRHQKNDNQQHTDKISHTHSLLFQKLKLPSRSMVSCRGAYITMNLHCQSSVILVLRNPRVETGRTATRAFHVRADKPAPAVIYRLAAASAGSPTEGIAPGESARSPPPQGHTR